ncbi:hypothetical protein FHS57_005077 [Runella defluvii]|uniref:Uncharacterized protein n=1 Tax=Runella defluvii TaxID=370973 RepID=A0A7W5ZQF6_9BACT|nr:hypothetical protein [Runella defluvii]MBB3841056.1 hypothetical protein [Runella defluvii]
MKKANPNYALSVFINCPFDSTYNPLFESLIFGVHACGFIARCALESNNSNDIRIQKIVRMMGECKLGIHDLSRIETAQGLPRFNMPLELGLFMGCQQFGGKSHKEKKYLILDTDGFRYKQFISDLGGQDIKSHRNDSLQLIQSVRDWLSEHTTRSLPHGSYIFENYQRFHQDLPELCTSLKWTMDELTFSEFVALTVSWLSENMVYST